MRNVESASRQTARKLINSAWFNLSILSLIVLNGLLIGVQTYDGMPSYIQVIQLCILFVFFIEVVLRWHGRKSTKEYLKDRWNWFDVFILTVGIVPEVAGIIFPEMDPQKNSVFATLRVLRIVQLTRSIRAIEELRILIGVLLRSIKSLSYIAVLFLLITYIYAIMGVSLFRNPQYSKSEHLELTLSNPDPYGDLGEAFFTLFRILTGEDWTDLRYNLLRNEYTQKNKKAAFNSKSDVPDLMNTVPSISNWSVTFFHVSWMVIAAYLLVNLVVGAIVNNFQLVLDAKREEEERFNLKRSIQKTTRNEGSKTVAKPLSAIDSDRSSNTGEDKNDDDDDNDDGEAEDDDDDNDDNGPNNDPPKPRFVRTIRPKV
jgi:voltage-gated sodium channel